MANTFDCNQVPAADVNATQLSTVKVCEPVSGSVWQNEQPNEITAYNADYTSVSRNPISMNRAARKGTVSDIEVAPGFQTDVTISTAEYWIPPFLYSRWTGGTTLTGNFTAPGEITLSESYTLPYDLYVMIDGKKYDVKESKNNVDHTKLIVDGLTTATGPATVEIIGGIPELSYADGVLTITDNSFDFPVGSQIFIGSGGFARIRKKISLSQYEIDNTDLTSITETETPVYFSSFVSNVSQDSDLFERTQMTFEARFNTDPVTYQYARAVEANQLTVNAPLTDKMTMDMTFIAQEMQTVTEALPGAGHVDYLKDEALNTVTNISRVRIADLDDKGLSTYMKDVTLTINNNAQGEKVLGKMGSAFTSLGDLEVTVSTETVMTDASVLQAIENNTSVDFTLACKNGDGALLFNIPTATISNGAKSMNRGEKVKISTDLTGYLDADYGFVVGVSLFKYLP